MREKIPIRLKKEPLIEAIWEIRFTGTKPSIGDLLPGIIFKAFPEKYPNLVRLPSAEIPSQIVERDPNFRYIPRVRLEGGNQAVQIGEHVFSLSCRRPYSGWIKFSGDIRSLIKVLEESQLIDHLERFSLKYIDLIDLDQPPKLSCLNLELRLEEYDFEINPVQLRTEIKEDSLIHIIQVISPAEVIIPGEPNFLRGILVDIDSIKHLSKEESWPDINKCIDLVHLASKKMFFKLLKQETIDKLEPVYEE